MSREKRLEKDMFNTVYKLYGDEVTSEVFAKEIIEYDEKINPVYIKDTSTKYYRQCTWYSYLDNGDYIELGTKQYT